MTETAQKDTVFEFAIAYGWSAPSILEQLEAFGIEGVSIKKITTWQKAADGILSCAMNDFMTDSEAMKTRNRMARKIEAYLVENKHLVAAEDTPNA